MLTSPRKALAAKTYALALLAVSAACQGEPAPRPVSPWAQSVRVETSDPPPGSRWVAEIEATDGKGCGIGGDRGSLRNATAALQEAAARRGASFVKLTEVIKPYSGRDCYHLEFTLRGSAYALPGSAPPQTQAPAPACDPPCSPGYACSSTGACVALCNPACAPQEMCRSDRVCVPAPAQ